MKMKRLLSVCAFSALTFGLLAISASSVFAEDPRPQGIPFSAMPWPTARPLRVGETWSPSTSTSAYNPSTAPSIPAIVLPQNSAPLPVPPSIPVIVIPQNPAPAQSNVLSTNNPAPVNDSGASPSYPRATTGSWDTLGAGASVWYRIGNGGVHMDVFLDTSANNVSLAVYAPNQFHKPIGYGTPHKGSDRLAWAGGHWKSQGAWVAQVTNGNPMPISYRLTSFVRDISNKSCYSYWEYIGPNYTYWTECQ